jgi:hypothetical protein
LEVSFATLAKKAVIITVDTVPAGPYVTDGTLQEKAVEVGLVLVKFTVRRPPEFMLAVPEGNPPPQVAA